MTVPHHLPYSVSCRIAIGAVKNLLALSRHAPHAVNPRIPEYQMTEWPNYSCKHRNPTYVIRLDGALNRFRAQGPAWEPWLQRPPRDAAAGSPTSPLP
jgi:hypothetical protein